MGLYKVHYLVVKNNINEEDFIIDYTTDGDIDLMVLRQHLKDLHKTFIRDDIDVQLIAVTEKIL
jgi:hypothetical protein